MSDVILKIGPIPDRTPQKMAVLVDPWLALELDEYARIHSDIHGTNVSASTLVPLMLKAFLASDTGVRKARKT